MSYSLLLFPNQLFSEKVLKPILTKYHVKKIYFIEDPLYYGERKGSQAVSSLSLNQLRLLYMYVVHRKYVEIIASLRDTVYWEEDSIDYTTIKDNVIMFDPCDYVLVKKLQSFFPSILILDSPSFLLNKRHIEDYKKNHSKRLQHSVFYKYVKSIYHILEDIPSTDKENRTPYHKDIPLPKDPYRFSYSEKEIWLEGLAWLKKSRYHTNPKPLITWDEVITTYLTKIPLTHNDVDHWFKDFLKNRFEYYGKYQDVIIDTNNLLYHSGLSIFLNNGLIIPIDVIRKVKPYEKYANSYEGFLRQVMGWREYSRYYYITVTKDIYQKNIFKNAKKILGKEWYRGTIGIPIVDKTIQNAFNYGYINHIQRLMVISNYMNLSGYHPNCLYKWMYEFSLDSYEWVMVFNCYSMGTWGDGGYAMRKPYISSASYLLKMSNEKNDSWSEKWNHLFRRFLEKNRSIIEHTPLSYILHRY